MDNHFTKEGLQLAIFKMCLENNAMLHTVINSLSRLFAMMPDNLVPYGEEMENLRIQYEEQCKKMSAAYEQMIIPHMADFAAEHDSGLDNDLVTIQSRS